MTDKRTIWRHNSFIGSAVMMQKQCQSIIAAQTTTEASKRKAEVVYSHAKELETELRKGRK